MLQPVSAPSVLPTVRLPKVNRKPAPAIRFGHQPDAAFNLTGKSAVVTGSTSGIGLAIARSLAQSGCNVMLNGFGNPEEIKKLIREISEETGVKILYSDADMRKPARIKQMIRQAVQGFGKVDILVNNAGIQHVAPVDKFSGQKWQSILDINLSSAFYTIKAVLPQMRKQGWGRIINIASAHGHVASPFKSAYVAAKHGLVGLSKVVALETAKDGITCNVISPGYVKTPLVEKQIKDQATAHGISEKEVIDKVMLVKQPTKSFVEPGEVANSVLFLCSEAAKSITGDAIHIDGGWVAE